MSNVMNHAADILRVKQIAIDENGNVTKRFPRIDTEGQLKNTLLFAMLPEICVLSMQVPTGLLDAYEQARISQILMRPHYEGRDYCLIGASGSAKDGKFYAVDAQHEKLIADRFQKWPQAAITYFGILVSDCKVVIQEPNVDLLVVADHALGTNDCRGWISERLFRKLNLPGHRFYQFRLAFDRTQAKGCFKVMQDEVADLLQADIIVPQSSVKPKQELSFLNECQNWLRGFTSGIEGMRFRSPIVLGIRDYSRELEFKSSYTLIEHAPPDSLMTEIIPRALREVRDVVSSTLSGDYQKLLEAIGTSPAQPKVEDAEDTEFTSYENSIVEAVLKADGSGLLFKHPYINGKLQQLLAKWAFKVSTGGGFRMPAFALADDGYLFSHDGQVFSGSDWIPEDWSISSLSTKRGLVIRYPIRMKEDLLPIQMLSFVDTANLLEQVLRRTGCRMDAAQIGELVERQLKLPGTFSLHSKTAERNGGDFDFDLVAVLQDSEFPRFVQSRFDMREGYQKKKDKKTKIKSPWWNLADVAMKARGNQIGRITNLISDCIAAGRSDLACELVDQLQNALDSLKHNVQVDQEVIKRIRGEVPKAAWLATKEARRISQMPMHVPVRETDIVGQLYNLVRKEIGVLFEDVLPLRDFGGMIRGETFDRNMYEECRKINKTFGTLVGELRKRTEKCEAAVADAQTKFEAVRDHQNQNADLRKKALKALYRAKAALRDNEERSREEMRNFHRFLAEWGNGKRENRRGWCQALHSIVTSTRSAQDGKATGAIVFHAFPQEALDKLLEETGGRPIQLHLPELLDGEILFDTSGNVYRVERIPLGGGHIQDRQVFLFQITEQGNIILDGGIRRGSVQPFPIQEGPGEIRNGTVRFTNLPQRPTVRIRPTLRTREDRQGFIAKCVERYGDRFAVFVDGDPKSIRQVDTPAKRQAFIESAAVRPWEARPLLSVQEQVTSKTVIGRWYEAVAGPGLEVKTGNSDPDLAWRVAGYIETVGKGRPVYVVKAGGEEGGTIGTCRSMEEARDLLRKSAGVTLDMEC
jgi:RNA dependent RNA polymerase